ncbi:GNAT family N-acetyltransferase [Pseudoflavonifractor sp. MSJ-37]|uniref:GNAT family N-acetyltransferase n=1 Tax=Pseudoflavonifractor sp. MSJ-37 TaxID=2841531 RepID=UPI001C0F9462|nr:GNAT family N-acetyltransferase [Pseudoflavonifractor sp. MSJ-37]MBU5434594.1 GNAT family N-acetyltransferase [Pseudoflavonifractor sp. MSJ-37]
MELETERLILRPFRPEDAMDLYAYAKDPRVGPPAGWRPHRSVEESREIIETVFSAPGVFAVVPKELGRAVGSAGFTGRHRKEARGADDEIGYSLSPAWWGRGLIPEAVEALLRYGFRDMGLDTIWCEHYDGNRKSKRVIRKCGFRFRFLRMQRVPDFGGEPRLSLIWSMDRRDWEARQPRAGEEERL